MPRSRRPLLLALAGLLLVPAWAVVAAGIVQVRACVPGDVVHASAVGNLHLVLLRPTAACPSGHALDQSGIAAVVGTIALTTVLAHLVGLGALAGLSALAWRAVRVVRGIAAARPWHRVPGAVAVHVRGLALVVRTTVSAVVRWERGGAVGLRAPPLPA